MTNKYVGTSNHGLSLFLRDRGKYKVKVDRTDIPWCVGKFYCHRLDTFCRAFICARRAGKIRRRCLVRHSLGALLFRRKKTIFITALCVGCKMFSHYKKMFISFYFCVFFPPVNARRNNLFKIRRDSSRVFATAVSSAKRACEYLRRTRNDILRPLESHLRRKKIYIYII